MATENAHVLLDRILDPVSRCLTPDVARRILALRADAIAQARVDALACKSNEGTLAADERAEYEAYVAAAGLIAILQAKARAALAAAAGAPEPVG